MDWFLFLLLLFLTKYELFIDLMNNKKKCSKIQTSKVYLQREWKGRKTNYGEKINTSPFEQMRVILMDWFLINLFSNFVLLMISYMFVIGKLNGTKLNSGKLSESGIIPWKMYNNVEIVGCRRMLVDALLLRALNQREIEEWLQLISCFRDFHPSYQANSRIREGDSSDIFSTKSFIYTINEAINIQLVFPKSTKTE